MESTRPIRALMRGLDALTVLNLRDGATVSEVAHEIRLPRTTVYRILETLSSAGFVFRDSADDRYRLTRLVQGLSGGFDDDPWVGLVAKPCIVELGREIVWPVSVGTLSGTTMVLRETTDHGTPLAIERYSAGFRVPLLGNSMGYAFLAFCPPAQRETLLDQLMRSNKPEDKAARAPRDELLRTLVDIKTAGYATSSRTQRLVEELSLSIPAMEGDRVLATLTVRFAASAVPLNTALERFLPKLRQCAAKMSKAFLESAGAATAQ